MSEVTFGEAYISLINAIIDDCRAEIADDEVKRREIRREMMDICKDFDGFAAKREEKCHEK